MQTRWHVLFMRCKVVIMWICKVLVTLMALVACKVVSVVIAQSLLNLEIIDILLLRLLFAVGDLIGVGRIPLFILGTTRLLILLIYNFT